jgi:hypothetical protein
MQNHRLNHSCILALGLGSLLAFGCDAPGSEEELAQDLLAEDDDDDAEEPASGHPKTVDELTSELHPTFAGNYFTPVGTHDATSCLNTAGWAKDGDSTAATYVHIYKDAAFPYGTYVTSVLANAYRADLPFADKNHGFSLSTPAAFKTGAPETMFIHAINIDTDGNEVIGATHPLLSNTERTICCRTPGGGPCVLHPGS